MGLLDWLFKYEETDLNSLPFTTSAYPPDHFWTLKEFKRLCGRMRLYKPNGYIEKVVFTNGQTKHTVICVSSELKAYSANDINRDMDKLCVKVMESGKYCLYKEWESVPL